MIKILLVSILMLSVSGFADSHIFLLAGQSNIHRMDPETGFIPELKKVLPEGKIKYVKLAQSGNPIRMWVKGWENLPGADTAKLEKFENPKTFGRHFQTIINEMSKLPLSSAKSFTLA